MPEADVDLDRTGPIDVQIGSVDLIRFRQLRLAACAYTLLRKHREYKSGTALLTTGAALALRSQEFAVGHSKGIDF